MKNKLLMLFTLLAMAGTSYAYDLEPLHVDGRYMKNPNGDIVTLHGLQQCVHPYTNHMGAIWVGDDYEKAVKYNKEWIDSLLMVDWKIDYMRLQIGAEWIENRATHNYDLDYFKQKGFFDKVYVPLIEYMNSKGIYAVLYYDGISPAEDEKHQIGDMPQRCALEFWDYVSSHPKIKNNPGVMMELFNEPPGFLGNDGHVDDFRDVKNYFQPMIDIIRGNGCQCVIWVPGIGQVYFNGFATNPMKGENIGYAFHAYPWWGISYEENNAPWWNKEILPVGNMAPLMMTETYWWNEDPNVNETSEFGIGLKNDIDRMGNVSWNLLTDHCWDVVRVNEPSPDGSITENNDDEFALVPTWNWFKEYADSKILPVSRLKAVSVEMEDAPTSVFPGQSRALKLMAKFDNGNTWNVAGDAVWSSSDETVLSIDRGNIYVKKEGKATIHGIYTDGTGHSFDIQFEAVSTMFPLTATGVNYFDFSTVFDAATQTFTGDGSGGWSYPNGIDLSSYRYLVIHLQDVAACAAGICLDDGIHEAVIHTELSWKSEMIIDLQSLTDIDLTHIARVLIWKLGTVLVKEIFLSNDGVNPVAEPFTIRTLANTDDKVMHYGDEVPELTYSVVGPDLSQVPALSTNVTKGSAVGAYDISIAGNEDGVDYYPGKLHVIPAPLTASTGNLSLKEGEEIPVISPKYDGFKNGDTEETAIIEKPTASATIVGWAIAGSYPIRVNGDGKVSNYSIDYDQTGMLTVEKSEDILCTDMTALLGTSQEDWHAWNATDPKYAPIVTTTDGRQAQMMETYETTVEKTGEIMFQSITGLENGDYLVGVYANAIFTEGRGFESDIEDGASDVVYISANGVRVYLPAYRATSVENNSICGIRTKVTDGTLRISMIAEKPGTNWHTIQTKCLVLLGKNNVSIAGPEQYAAAQKTIEYEKKYGIYTTFNGKEEGTQRYYLTAEGYLTTEPTEACLFTFHKTEGNGLFSSPGWKFDACFSNPKLSENGGATGNLNPQGHILTDAGNNRNDWEGQVWYLDDKGRYAVRATNAVSNEWGAATFWNVLDTDSDGRPEADYSWSPAFIWQLESESDLTVTVTADNKTMVYGDEMPELTYTNDGSAFDGTPQLTTVATSKSPVGTYPILVKKGTVENKIVACVAGTLTITKAPLTIKAGTYTKRERDSIPQFIPIFEGFKNNETKEVLAKQPVLTCGATDKSEPGEYPIVVSGAEAQNYDISYVPGVLIVTELPYFTLTYLVDGTIYKTDTIKEGYEITPEAFPTKEGYTFSGWNEIPKTMPAKDVTVTGTFIVNKYKLKYTVDGEEYKMYDVEYGAAITPEPVPTKYGYTFSGWSDIPKTMPANDVTVTGTFTINKYKLTYKVDGTEYKTVEVEYGAVITPEAIPTKEGYTFFGWSYIPKKMPAYDVTITGTFTINTYKLTYMIDDKVYKVVEYKYGSAITPEAIPEGDYVSFVWKDVPETMPANDVTVYADYQTGIDDVLLARGIKYIYAPNGKRIEKLQKGLNIVVMNDGTVRKVVVR